MTLPYFFVAHEVNTSVSDVNKDLKIISDWYFQRKMSFNPDPSNQAKGIVFSRKKNEVIPPKCAF